MVTMTIQSEHEQYLLHAVDHAMATHAIADGIADEMIVETSDDDQNPEVIAARFNLGIMREDVQAEAEESLVSHGYKLDASGRWSKTDKN